MWDICLHRDHHVMLCGRGTRDSCCGPTGGKAHAVYSGYKTWNLDVGAGVQAAVTRTLGRVLYNNRSKTSKIAGSMHRFKRRRNREIIILGLDQCGAVRVGDYSRLHPGRVPGATMAVQATASGGGVKGNGQW